MKTEFSKYNMPKLGQQKAYILPNSLRVSAVEYSSGSEDRPYNQSNSDHIQTLLAHESDHYIEKV